MDTNVSRDILKDPLLYHQVDNSLCMINALLTQCALQITWPALRQGVVSATQRCASTCHLCGSRNPAQKCSCTSVKQIPKLC